MGKHADSVTYCCLLRLTLLLVSVQYGWSEEVVHGTVSEGGDAPSATDGQDLPTALSVNLSLPASDLHLNFSKDTDINPDLPVYTLFTDSKGKLQLHREKLNDTKVFAVYQDVTNGAAFGVTRETDENGTTYLKMEGVLHSGGKMFDVESLQPKLRHRRDVSDNVTTEGQEEFVLKPYSDFSADSFDSIRKPVIIQKKKLMATFRNITHPYTVPVAPPLRSKRAVTQDVYIDVVALADYAVYVDWYDRSTKTTQAGKREDALQNIRRYYAFIFNGVNLLYKSITSLPYTIHVTLSSVVVAPTAGSSPWTERYRVANSQWDEVDANNALQDLSVWAPTSDALPSYDHLMLFSGYDLTKTVSGVKSDKITGLAYTATLCDTNGKASSIVEDLGGFQCIPTAAHELGHGLSAEHDGTENTCSSTDRYIMAAGTSPETESNKYHPWLFSSCSINYFNNFLVQEVTLARGRTCVYGSLTVNANVPDVTSQMPGQLYDADAQCQQVYGPSSRLCRGPEFGTAADVCTDMYCYDPTTTSTCFMLAAARGTSCGNKKWCEDGQCVYNTAAPALDESCVFGDQPGIAFDNKDCATFVRNFTGYCYQNVVRGRCCSSCAKYYRTVTNCEYGDNASGCSQFGCNRGDTSYLTSCCGTCNYGTTFTPTTTTTIKPVITTTTAKPTTTTTVSNGGGNLKTTTSPGTAVDGTCVDNQQECSALVSSAPANCYNAQVNTLCCASCRARYTGVKDCEFGDRNTTLCSQLSLSDALCQNAQAECCQTCSEDLTGSQTRVVAKLLFVVSLGVLNLCLLMGSSLPGL